MQKTILLLLFLFSFYFTANAQFVEYPVFSKPALIEHPLTKKQSINKTSSNQKTAADTLQIPFFDDFSTYSGRPDTNLWLFGGGVRISNNTAIRPPSKGVAQFDGTDYYGIPYNTTTQLAQGNADTLTSQPINISSLLPQDNLFLSFFYQPRGLGEMPDGGDGDSLILEFKNNNNTWVKVWGVPGDTLKPFAQELIPLSSSTYFFTAFQFRFRSIGRLSGGYDSWQLDYVYLNKNRNVNDIAYKDIAIQNQPTSVLKRYTSMPFDQYLANKDAETADTTFTFATYINTPNTFNLTSYQFRLYNSSNLLYQQNYFNPITIQAGSRGLLFNIIDKSKINPASKKFTLNYTFELYDNITGLPLADPRVQNNIVTDSTVFDNYFAYDDGSAEYGGGINQKLGKVAVQFHVNKPDTLTSVQYYLPQLGRSLKGQTFVLSIWKDLKGTTESVLYQESVVIDTFNVFREYVLDSAVTVAVSDTFYVGWQQTTNSEQMNVGIDKNNTIGANYIYYNLGSDAWFANNSSINPLEGAFMVRPVFGSKGVISGIDDPFSPSQLLLYPNPAEDVIFWEGLNVNSLRVYDLLGRQVLERNNIKIDSKSLDVSSLQNGLYIINFQVGKKKLTKRIVISK